MPIKRAVKTKLKRLLSSIFIFGQRFGVDILPRHFYSEIPDIRKLRNTAAWRKEFTMTSVQGADLDEQLGYLRDLFDAELKRELKARNIHKFACASNKSEGFGRVESDVLYAFVRHMKPRRIIQIGCGVSTAICIEAARAAGYEADITCIEPYPSGFLKEQAGKGVIRLLPSAVETLDVSFFESLQSGDLFFVDSTHTLGPAGEVSRIILEILPRLQAGVFTHFHDIYFPYDFHGDILENPQFFSHESVLLHAFLTYNQCFRIRFSLSMLHHKRQAELKGLIASYLPATHDGGILTKAGHFPSSAYVEKIAEWPAPSAAG